MFKLNQIMMFRHFNSVQELVRYCDEGIADDERQWGELSSQSTDIGSNFHDSDDYVQASDRIRYGWPEGVRTMEENLAVISDGIGDIEIKQPEYDVCGPIPIVGAFCSGDPECMLNPAEKQEKPVINLVFEAAVSGTVKARNVNYRGAAILALAEKLEQAGRRVAIYAAKAVNCTRFAADEEKPVAVMITCVKQPDEVFNLHALSYVMTSSSFNRRHMFRVLERERATLRKSPYDGGYGIPLNIRNIEGVTESIVDIDLYFEKLGIDDHDFSTAARAAETVLHVAREAKIIA